MSVEIKHLRWNLVYARTINAFVCMGLFPKIYRKFTHQSCESSHVQCIFVHFLCNSLLLFQKKANNNGLSFEYNLP